MHPKAPVFNLQFRWRVLSLACAFVVSLPLSGLVLRAQWTGNTTNTTKNLYFDTGNWANGTINGEFLTGSLTATTQVTVATTGAPTAAGTFNLGDLDINYADAYGLTLVSASGSTWNLGNVTVNVSSTGYGTVNFGASSRPLTIDLGGAQRTFAVDAGIAGNNSTTLDTLNVFGNLTDGSVLKTGGGILALYGTNTLSGTFEVDGGMVQIGTSAGVTGSFTNLSNLVVTGNTNTDFARVILYGNTASNQVNTSAAILLNGGVLGVQAAQNTSATAQSLGTVSLLGARSALAVVSGSNTMASSQTATLTLASIVRDPYSTLSIISNTNGIGDGASSLLVTSDSNITASLYGGGGAAGTTTISIVPWATANSSNSLVAGTPTSAYFTAGTSTTNGAGFVTYTSSGGFRALTTAEYATSISSSTGSNNVALAATTLTGNAATNALLMNGALNLGGYTLTINSGAFIPTSTISNGTIDFGGGVAYFMPSRAAVTVSSTTLTAGAGFVFAGGTETAITLSSGTTVNAGTGPVVINSGIVNTAANNVLATTSALRVDRTATFNINGAYSQQVASIAGTGTIGLANASANMKVGSSFVDTVAGGQVLVGSGGSITPGDPSGQFQAGTLTFNSGVTSLLFESGSSLTLNLSGTDASTINLLGGGATINGGTLYINLLGGFVPTNGETFTSIVGTSAASGAGFTSIVDNSNSGYTWTLAANGNNWVLTATASAIPEPSACALIGGFAALLAIGLRRCWNKRG